MRAAIQRASPITAASVAYPKIQMKARIGPVDDPLEREADRIADAVVSDRPAGNIGSTVAGAAQRKCAECEKEDEKPVQRKCAACGGEAHADGGSAEMAAKAVSRGGAPLTAEERAYFEPRFGRDFSTVRLHTHTNAAKAASAIDARAFTYGRDIAFAAGEYAPDSPANRQLIAHELAHVVQQTSVAGNQIRRKLRVDLPSSFIPNSSGMGVTQTNADTAKAYLDVLCKDGSPVVDTRSGDVVLASSGYCDLDSFDTGALGTTPAMRSQTAAGCTCLCNIIGSNNDWLIQFDDIAWPQTAPASDAAAMDPTSGGSGGVVTVPTPNSPDDWGVVTDSGAFLDQSPWLALGHELCAHAWLMNQGLAGLDRGAPRGSGGHQAAVNRENLIRGEHGIERRGTYRDPYCGESYWRPKATPTGSPNLGSMAECKSWRDAYNKANKTHYTIADRIP